VFMIVIVRVGVAVPVVRAVPVEVTGEE